MSSDDKTQKLSPDTIVILTRLDAIEARLTALEKKVDERLHDTRPIWEAVQAAVADLAERVEKGFRIQDRRFEHLLGEVSRMHGEVRDLDDRMGKLEQKPS